MHNILNVAGIEHPVLSALIKGLSPIGAHHAGTEGAPAEAGGLATSDLWLCRVCP